MNKKIIKITIIVVISLAIILFAFMGVKTYKITGDSMYPTLEKNKTVLGITFYSLERGDLIAFKKNNEVPVIKRIIALPGETIDITDDYSIIINGVELKEDYLSTKEMNDIEQKFPLTVPENSYFVLGDNRMDSFDSKNYKVGFIKEEEIQSKIIFILNDFKKI